MARPRKSPGPPKGDPNAWMVTFSDLLMLMLTFFVLLLSMSSLDQQMVEEALRPGISNEGGTISPADAIGIEMLEPIVPDMTSERLRDRLAESLVTGDTTAVEAVLEEIFVQAHLSGHAWVERRPEGLLINLDGQLAFSPATATLTGPSRAVVREVAQLADALDLEVIVEAFVTDDTSNLDGTEENWDLALRRADSVAVFATGAGLSPNLLEIMGHGYAAGRDDLSFIRQRQLLRLTLRDRRRRG